MFHKIAKFRHEIILFLFIFTYVFYFSSVTILRHESLMTTYYDMGIMDQTVYNTSRARILELTDPELPKNINRIAIHNDLLLVLFAPFYRIFPKVETLLIIQSVVLSLGGVAVYLISYKILKSKILSLAFAASFLLYPHLQRANLFDFHAVTFSTTFILFMFYFALIKKYKWSFVFFLLTLISKEQVSLTLSIFGLYLIVQEFKKNWNRKKLFGLGIFIISIVWFILSVWLIIPSFRGNAHFAISRYQDFGESPSAVILGVLTRPEELLKKLTEYDSLRYYNWLFSPLLFLSLLSPTQFLIATPEFLINLLSIEWTMRNIIHHYTAVITPFVFISAIYGVARLKHFKFYNPKFFSFLIVIWAVWSNYQIGPLPFSKRPDINSFIITSETQAVKNWSKNFKDENIIISATPKIAPYFTQRKIFYLFDSRFRKADFVVIRKEDISNRVHPYDAKIEDIYLSLKKDIFFEKIYDDGKLEVYKKQLTINN